MTQVIYMTPKRTHLSWDPRLEPLDLETEPGVEVPLLGYVSAGRPVETPEDQSPGLASALTPLTPIVKVTYPHSLRWGAYFGCTRRPSRR